EQSEDVHGSTALNVPARQQTTKTAWRERYDGQAACVREDLLFCQLVVFPRFEPGSELRTSGECCVAVPYGRAARAAGGADRALSGFAALAGSDGLNLSIGGDRGRALGARQPRRYGRGAGRRDAEAAMGS